MHTPPPARASTEPAARPARTLSIVYKLALSISLLSVGVLGVLGWVLVGSQERLMGEQADLYGATVAGQLADAVAEPILAEDALALDLALNTLAERPGVQGAIVYTEPGVELARVGQVPGLPVSTLYAEARDLEGPAYAYDWSHIDPLGQHAALISYLAPVEFRGLVVGHALTSFDGEAMATSARAAREAITLTTIALALLSIVAAFMLSRRMARPIHDLVDASRAIGAGQLDQRFDTRRSDEIGTLFRAFDDMARGLLQKSQVEAVLSRYVSRSVANEILSDLTQVELGGRHVRGSVLFADMAGFTALSERMPPVEVGALLNAYFGLIARAAELYQGTVDKFIGDCAMLVFGVPEPDADHRFKAIACAVLIRRITERLNAQRERAGEPRVEFRIGISSGEMLAGNMGSTDRMQFTVVGDTVNLASRISSLAAPGEIVIREDHYLDPEVQRRILARKYRALRVRGRDEPITLYRVRDVATTYRERMDAELAQIFETVPG